MLAVGSEFKGNGFVQLLKLCLLKSTSLFC